MLEIGLAMHNTGDVDVQSISGAIGTGTHGSGIESPNLSWMLAGMRVVTGNGSVQDFSVDGDPALLNAARVALGSLGIFSAVTLQLQPAYKLLRHEWCTGVDQVFAHLDDLIRGNRHFDMYWYPRSDEVKLRTANEPGQGIRVLPWAKQVKEELGWVGEILPRHRTLKFEEATLELTIYHTNAAPQGPYALAVAPQRVRHIRINDLIDPRAIPLDVPYGLVISSSVRVIVQFSRRDTSQSENAIMTTLAYPVHA